MEEEIKQEQQSIEDAIHENEISTPLKLDYTIKDMSERAALVEKICSQTPAAQLTNKYLEILGDYIMNALPKEERKSRKYLTENRLVTVNKRETSFEGLAEKFENGEDGIYNLMTNERNYILTPKIAITDQDIEEVPGLKELRAAIAVVEESCKAATGRRKYLLKKQLIEMRRDQYVLKSLVHPQMKTGASAKGLNKIDLTERRWIDQDGEPQSNGLVSLLYPEHIAAIFKNYNGLKIQVRGNYWDDFYYLMEDFDKLKDQALRNEPILRDITQWKLEGKSNLEIQLLLQEKHGIKHSMEYISQLWSKKIPKLMAEQEKINYLLYYYQHERPEEATWKRCSCCKQWKLATTRFFSKNNTSKDGLYSQCKECRNKKK